MEVSESESTANEGDMGLPHADAIFTMCSASRHNFITMEGSEHIRIGNAKVSSFFPFTRPFPHGWPRMLILVTTSQILLLGTIKTPNADDTE